MEQSRPRPGRVLPDVADRLAAAGARCRELGRSRPARRAVLRRLLAAAAALGALSASTTAFARADAGRARWESTVEVLVATRDIEVGTTLGSSLYLRQLRPAALVPHAALHDPPADDTTVRARIVAGEVLVQDRLAGPEGSGSPVPPGRVAVDLVTRSPAATLGAGDRVDVFTGPAQSLPGIDPTTSGTAPAQAVAVATDAVVMEVRSTDDSTGLTAAVKERDLPAAAAAVLAGEVVVVRRSPSG